jgi:L-ascorbate metabolism protein UlaG (beta-lactamase superfamily)
MKVNYTKIFIITLIYFSQIFFSKNLFADSTSVKVTFISNSGMMISSGNKNIIIDALHTPGYYLSSDFELENHNKLINLKYPFENIDVILVTHSHPDHFHVPSSISHLTNNPIGKFISSEDVVSYMEYNSLYEQINSQIIEFNTIESDSLELNGIKVISFPIKHFEPFPGYQIPHLGYYININGIKIFFGGDNIAEGSEYVKYRLDKRNIDIAFYRFWDLFEKDNLDTLNQFVNPKVLIPMHYLYGDNFNNISEVEDSIRKYESEIPLTFIFRNYLESKTFYFETITSAEEVDVRNYENKLYQNYPNPFNPTTKIEFSLSSSAHTKVTVYNIMGEKVSNLVDKHLKGGNHSYSFTGSNLSSGLYFYKIESGEYLEIKKMIFIK